jgi:hypothetical protein
MKNIVLIALVGVALYFGPRSCGPVGEDVVSEPRESGYSQGGDAARQLQQAPNAVMDMQGAMGGGGGSAGAARSAVTNQVGGKSR